MRYAICYLEGQIERGIEEVVSLNEVLNDYREGLYYQHTDYFCSVFDTKEEALDAYHQYKYSYGQEYDMIWNNRYCYVSVLGEEDL